MARHGLGLYIYAGEDLPDATDGTPEPQKAQPKKAPAKKAEPKKEEPKEVPPLTEEELLFLAQRYKGENLEKLLDYFHIEDITQIQPDAGRALIKKIQEQKQKKTEG